MKKFTKATLIALLLSNAVFSQTKNEPVKNHSGGSIVNEASNSRLILLSPADENLFTGSEGSKPVVFRWTAIVPKPKEAVTYCLKVWQLMQGQNSTEAMRNNQPIITKDVINITQAAISNLYTGPCKPPYLCNFVWAVEVLNSDGVTISNTYAASSSFKFEVENIAAENVEGGNKGNAGNTGMSGGKSLDANGDPVHGVDVKLGVKAASAQGDPVHGVDVKLGVKSKTQEDPTAAVNINGLPPGQPVIIDGGIKVKEDNAPVVNLNGLPPGQPVIIGGGAKAQGDPIHGVDIKPGIKNQNNKSTQGKQEKNKKSTKAVTYDVALSKKV